MANAKKPKNKRLTASKKHKIQKKVNEHHRKMRKEAKKNPGHRKLKKDPGIPSLFPFKEKLLQQIEETKRLEEEEKKRGISDRKPQSGTDGALAALLSSAQARSMTFDNMNTHSNEEVAEVVEAAASGRKDNSKKAYQKEFTKVIQQADVILEVLDARDPLGCRPKKVEELILNAGLNKRIILVLNKIDLVPRDVVEKWLKHLRNEYPTVAFKANTNSQRSNLGQAKTSVKSASEDLINSSESLGADNLVKLLKNYCRNANIKTSITVGVIGYPNVGKSSVINSLKRSKACQVGATAGVTKVAQEIHLDKHIKLLDCPGIIWAAKSDSAETLLRNCVKVELIEDPIAPVELLVSKCKKEHLMQIYSIPAFIDSNDFLIHVAKQRGKLKKGGVADLAGTARSILQDWNSGKIPFYSLPPATGVSVGPHIESSICTTWSEEFQLPDIVAVESAEVLSSARPQGNTRGMLLIEPSRPSEDVFMDDDEEFSDHDNMEEYVDHHDAEVVEQSAVAMNMNRIKTKKAPTAALPSAERLLNPRINLDRKNALKKEKKSQRRAGRAALGYSEESLPTADDDMDLY